MIGTIIIGGCRLSNGFYKSSDKLQPNLKDKNNNFTEDKSHRDMNNITERQNPIDEETKNQIISFFESTNNLDEIKSYCETNYMYCNYYCREINQEHEVCKQVRIPPGGQKPADNES